MTDIGKQVRAEGAEGMSDICLTCGGMIFTQQDGVVGYAGAMCYCPTAPRIQRPAKENSDLQRLLDSIAEDAQRAERLEQENAVLREALEKIQANPLGSNMDDAVASKALEKARVIREGE